MAEALLRIQFDETLLIGRLGNVDSKLDRHEEMILEIQKLISEEMKTPEVQKNVAAILKSAIPDFSPLAEVHINASSITVELAEQIKDYLLKVKKEKKASLLKDDVDQTVND